MHIMILWDIPTGWDDTMAIENRDIFCGLWGEARIEHPKLQNRRAG